MRAVRFTIRGKLAHFSRFYTNSSSLTYPIPPPTTVRGMLGAAMGLDAGTYTDTLAEARFAIRPIARWRNLMQTVNQLLITGEKASEASLRGHSGPRTQIPIQFLAPIAWEEPLSYEIVMVHEDTGLIDRVSEAVLAPHYPLALGSAFCLAWAEESEIIDGDRQESYEGTIAGALETELADDLPLMSGVRLLRDRYPTRLSTERRLDDVRNLFVDEVGQTLNCRYSGTVLITEENVYALQG